MEDKYYTPSIEDIHTGYELERFYNEDWHKEICTDNYHWQTWSKGKIRTKGLDKEDIESLGWKYTRSYKDNLHFETDNIWDVLKPIGFLEYNIITCALKITTKDSGYNSDGPVISIKFNGTCKSINELRLLQKLINI